MELWIWDLDFQESLCNILFLFLSLKILIVNLGTNYKSKYRKNKNKSKTWSRCKINLSNPKSRNTRLYRNPNKINRTKNSPDSIQEHDFKHSSSRRNKILRFEVVEVLLWCHTHPIKKIKGHK